MNSKNILILVFYYLGIISCAAQGAEKGKYKNQIAVDYYISNAFGGGVLRDVLFLDIYPWFLTLSALPDFLIVVITGCLYSCYLVKCKRKTKLYSVIMLLVTITDAFGLGSFICLGMDRAAKYSSNVFIIIVCGYVTAIGGGVIASKKPFALIFNNKKIVMYHFVTVLGCCYYYIYKHSFALVCFVAIGVFVTSVDYRKLYFLYYYNIISSYSSIYLLYLDVCCKSNYFKKRNIIWVEKKYAICSICSKIYLVQRRIRQC